MRSYSLELLWVNMSIDLVPGESHTLVPKTGNVVIKHPALIVLDTFLDTFFRNTVQRNQLTATSILVHKGSIMDFILGCTPFMSTSWFSPLSLKMCFEWNRYVLPCTSTWTLCKMWRVRLLRNWWQYVTDEENRFRKKLDKVAVLHHSKPLQSTKMLKDAILTEVHSN